jgi:hypothetical protein
MLPELTNVFGWLFGPEDMGRPGHLFPRWLWLRALGLIFSPPSIPGFSRSTV